MTFQADFSTECVQWQHMSNVTVISLFNVNQCESFEQRMNFQMNLNDRKINYFNFEQIKLTQHRDNNFNLSHFIES